MYPSFNFSVIDGIIFKYDISQRPWEMTRFSEYEADIKVPSYAK